MADKKINYGAEIKFRPYHKGTEIGIKYSWIVSMDVDFPETTFIHKHPVWKSYGSKRMIRALSKAISHEIIHNIIYYKIGIKNIASHDLVIQPFLRLVKKQDPEHYKTLGL